MSLGEGGSRGHAVPCYWGPGPGLRVLLAPKGCLAWLVVCCLTRGASRGEQVGRFGTVRKRLRLGRRAANVMSRSTAPEAQFETASGDAVGSDCSNDSNEEQMQLEWLYEPTWAVL